MGLNDIEISNPLLAELFRNHLLAGNTVEMGTEPPAATFLVITDREGEISEASETFLKGILSACRIPENSTRVVDAPAVKKMTIEKAIEKHHPSVVLAFGNITRQKDIASKDFFEKDQWNDTQILFCPPLQELQADRDQKLKLWNFLKEFFRIA